MALNDGKTLLALLVVMLAACGDNTPGSSPAQVLNVLPVADAGPDQSVKTGSEVTLDGSGSGDADGDLITYSWSLAETPAGSQAELLDANSPTPRFTPDADGDYLVRLTVNDGKEDSEPDSVSIAASTSNSAPVADAGADQSVKTGSEVTLDGSGSSDPDGDALTYAWSFVSRPGDSGATLSDPAAAGPVFTPDVDGEYVVALSVDDGTASSQPDTVTIVAATSNSPPVADAGPNQTVAIGSTVVLDGSGSSDPDGDALAYAWSFVSLPEGSAAALSNADTAAPSFIADLEGGYVVQLRVSDGAAESAAQRVFITAGLDWCEAIGGAPVSDSAGSSIQAPERATDGHLGTYAAVKVNTGSASVKAESATAFAPGTAAGAWVWASASAYGYPGGSPPRPGSNARGEVTINTYLAGDLRETSSPHVIGYMPRQYLSIPTSLAFDAVEVLVRGVAFQEAATFASVYEICADGGVR